MSFHLFNLGGMYFRSGIQHFAKYAGKNQTFSEMCHRITNNYIRTNNHLCKTLKIENQIKSLTREESEFLGSVILGESILISTVGGLMYWRRYKDNRDHQLELEKLRKEMRSSNYLLHEKYRSLRTELTVHDVLYKNIRLTHPELLGKSVYDQLGIKGPLPDEYQPSGC